MFLNFVDAMARFQSGRAHEACEILKRVGEWDLEKAGDYMPAEYLDGNTGANAGKQIQGWDANYCATIVHGLFDLKILSKSKIELMPRLPDTASFETPECQPSHHNLGAHPAAAY